MINGSTTGSTIGNKSGSIISRDSGGSLVEQIVRNVATRIDDKLLRTGARMLSIRQFADEQRVSRFTVVEAYDRLVAKGYLESRRGSGFFVRERASMISSNNASNNAQALSTGQQLDVVWLVRNMFRQLPPQKMRWEFRASASGLRVLRVRTPDAIRSENLYLLK